MTVSAAALLAAACAHLLAILAHTSSESRRPRVCRRLGKMKFARGQLGLDHILWGHRVVRVERAHRNRIVRDVQKLLAAVSSRARFLTRERDLLLASAP
jgi:hypothetical protein